MFDFTSFPRARLGPRERTLILVEVPETCLVAYKTTETDFVVLVEIRLEQNQLLFDTIWGLYDTASSRRPGLQTLCSISRASQELVSALAGLLFGAFVELFEAVISRRPGLQTLCSFSRASQERVWGLASALSS